MLDSRVGGVRPWELEAFTPDEEKALHRYREVLSQEVG